MTRLLEAAARVGWVDDYTLIYQAFATPAMHMFSLTSHADAAVDAPGFPVALLPGGF